MKQEHPISIELQTTPTLAKNFQLLLKQHHLTASTLAETLHLPIMTIRRLLSGETTDPRVSTLKLIADYFDVSIDFFMHDNPHASAMIAQHITPYQVPKISWDKITDFDASNLKNAQDSELIFISQSVSTNAFALESRPSMHPRFPKGTLFIIDPAATPKDGDIVLVYFKENNEHTLKELMIDLPDLRLQSLMTDANSLCFQPNMHELCGVVILTLFYHG